MTNQEGVCPICRRHGTLTREHIVGDWLRKAVRRAGGDPLPEITMQICGTCNHRLGKYIEVPVAPIALPLIRGEQPVELSAAHQRHLLRWAFKVMVMMDLSRFGHAVPEVFHDWITKDGYPYPPVGATAWIGHLDEDAIPMSMPDLKFVEPTIYNIVEWGGAYFIGSLAVFGVYPPTYRHRLPTHPAESLSFLVQLGRVDDKFPVVWPPSRALDRTAFDAVCRTYPI